MQYSPVIQQIWFSKDHEQSRQKAARKAWDRNSLRDIGQYRYKLWPGDDLVHVTSYKLTFYVTKKGEQ